MRDYPYIGVFAGALPLDMLVLVILAVTELREGAKITVMLCSYFSVHPQALYIIPL